MSQVERDRGAHRERVSRFHPVETPRRERSPSIGYVLENVCAMHILKLPYDWTWKNLKEFVMDNVGEVKFTEMLDGEQRGTGYVEFRNREVYNRAFLALKGTSIDGRKIVLKETSSKHFPIHGKNTAKKAKDFRMTGKSEGGTGPAVIGNTYGLNQQFLETLGIQGPLVSRVFVLNLDFQVDKVKLKEVFRMAGNIRDIEFHTGKDGKTKGMATIEYEHPVEAVQAISMFNTQTLFERQMAVRMDRNPQREKKLPEGLKGVGPGLGSNGAPMRDVAKVIEKQDQCASQNNQISTETQSQYSANSSTNDFTTPQPANMQMAAAASMNMNQPMWNANMNQMLMHQAAMSNVAQNANMMNANSFNMGMNTAAMMNNNVPAMNPMVNNGMMASGMTGDMAQAMGTNLMASQVMAANPMMAMGNTQNNTLLALANLQQQGVNMNELATMLATFTGQGNGTSQTGGMAVGNQTAAAASSIAPSKQDLKMEGQNVSSKSAGREGRDGRRPSDMLSITNLPPSVSRNMIHEKFREAGEVKFVDMIGPGSALVRYLNHWDAERAINVFDRTLVNGNIIEVQFYY